MDAGFDEFLLNGLQNLIIISLLFWGKRTIYSELAAYYHTKNAWLKTHEKIKEKAPHSLLIKLR